MSAKTPTIPKYDRLAPSTGIAVGKYHGHIVQKRDVSKTRQARVKGTKENGKKIKAVRALIAEVSGLAPYEKKLLDMLKIFGTSADKKMYKQAKKRLGTHKRALKKREEIKERMMKERAKAQA
jgi:large subunit ribosomal protein L36e